MLGATGDRRLRSALRSLLIPDRSPEIRSQTARKLVSEWVPECIPDWSRLDPDWSQDSPSLVAGLVTFHAFQAPAEQCTGSKTGPLSSVVASTSLRQFWSAPAQLHASVYVRTCARVCAELCMITGVYVCVSARTCTHVSASHARAFDLVVLHTSCH